MAVSTKAATAAGATVTTTVTATNATAAAPAEMREEVVRLARGEGPTVALSPLDVMNRGRSIPLGLFYDATLDAARLIAALRAALDPVLCGRYAAGGAAVAATDAGVPVEVVASPLSLAAARAHLVVGPGGAPAVFARTAHEAAWAPTKAGMDPDVADGTAPLVRARVTHFRGGGTALGVLARHGVTDARGLLALVRRWAAAYRGEAAAPATYDHAALCAASADGCDASRFVVDPGPPPFAPLLPAIAGEFATRVPLPAALLRAWKAAAGARSADDVATARCWRALCAVRAGQVGPLAGETTCMRAVDVRGPSRSALAPNYALNGARQVWTTMDARALLNAPDAAVCRALRADLETQNTPAATGAAAAWLRDRQRAGHRTAYGWDARGLTFIVSSWRCDWEGAVFDAAPVAIDHGALTPVVASFTRRPNGDGLDVWTAGPQAAVDAFATALLRGAD